MIGSRLALAGLLLSATAASAALLGPTPYLSSTDSPFSGGSFTYFHLENFEDGLLNTPGAIGNGISTSPGGSTDSVDADDGATDGSGQAGRSYYSNFATSSFEFSFSAAILGALPTHACIVWTDVGQVSLGTLGFGGVTFEAFDENGDSLGVIGPNTLGDGAVTGATTEDRFYGATNATGISRIVISMNNSTDWEVDHLQYGLTADAVPEPSTIVLCSLSLLALAARRFITK